MKGFPSLLPVILSFLIIGIVPWARRILRFIYSLTGREFIALWLKILFLTGIFIGIIYFLKKKIKISPPSLLFLVPAIPFTILFFKIKLPEEKVHLLEYALLGLLIYRDFFKGRIGLLSSVFFIITVAFLDELFQLILPDRFFDYRDIIFNVSGGFTGFFSGKFLSIK